MPEQYIQAPETNAQINYRPLQELYAAIEERRTANQERVSQRTASEVPQSPEPTPEPDQCPPQIGATIPGSQYVEWCQDGTTMPEDGPLRADTGLFQRMESEFKNDPSVFVSNVTLSKSEMRTIFRAEPKTRRIYIAPEKVFIERKMIMKKKKVQDAPF